MNDVVSLAIVTAAVSAVLICARVIQRSRCTNVRMCGLEIQRDVVVEHEEMIENGVVSVN